MNLNCSCTAETPNSFEDNCEYLTAAYIFAGLSMMLNIRLAYSSAPYALIRFRLPENLFSVFVRRMASALELWCLPSMLLGNIMDIIQKLLVTGPEIRAIMEKATDIAGKATEIKNNAGAGKLSGPAEQLNSAAKNLTGANVENAENFKTQYDAFEKAFDANPNDQENVKSHWDALKKTIKNSNAMKCWKLYWIIVPSVLTMLSDFITYLVLLYVYVAGGNQGHVTAYYGVIAVSGFIFGINMTLVYAADWRYIYLYIAGENSFPALTSFIHYITTLIFGNRRKWNSDFLIVCIDIGVAILISLTTAILWTLSYLGIHGGSSNSNQDYRHIQPPDKIDDSPYTEIISPALMVIVGMGLVYAIYPGIAPGMIVPFYLIDKIEMVLLVATIFPPVIVAMLIKYKTDLSPKTQYASTGWTSNGPYFYHGFDILMIIKISLAIIFIYSLHYRDSNISRAIVNQPKMSTFLSITFYMCHEILLALGFPGIVGNKGANVVMLPAQYVGALFMIFLAFYSEGYIIEYKSHDPAHWPTEGMTKWNAFCYWCKRASKITNHNLRSLFTTDLRRDLLLCIQKNELI